MPIADVYRALPQTIAIGPQRSCAREAWDLPWWADLQHPEGAEAKMRAATAVWATLILILVTEVWACAARAEDAIKPGKWEFWTVGSKIPEPPPGTQLPPSMRWGPEGMITERVPTRKPQW